MDDKVFHAFTTKNNGRALSLRNDVSIQGNQNIVRVKALWDTGATGSCISKDVVDKLNLVPTGCKDILTPSGKKKVNTYLVSVALPNKVMIEDMSVCDSDIGEQGLGILIGMDIITLGDFSVSNYDGKTVFSFRVPSKKLTDYCAEINVENIIGKKHGQGKRKKKR